MAIQNRRGADADFDPNKVLPGEFGFTTDGSRKVYAAFAPNDVKEVAFKEDVPTKTSDLANDTGFVTKTVADLINYYTKSETYTQEEINQLVSTIPKFSIQPVPELPTEKISTTTVYLLTTGEESQNLYTEYIYVNGAWEKLGTQKLDLSRYALKTDIPTKLSELINDTEFITAAVDNLVNYYTKKEMEERLYEKANSIISTRTGTVVATTDSAKAKPKNIKLFGKSEQDGTPSIEASIEIQSHGDSGSIVGKVLGKNLYIGRYYYMHYISGKIYIENENSVVFPYTPADEKRGVCKIVQCIAGEKYTLYASNPNTNAWLGITEYTNIDSSFNDNNSVDFAQNGGSGESITYIAKTNGILLCGISGKWTDGSTSIHTCTEDEEVQVEIGDVATSYEEPYTEQPFTVFTEGGLKGLKNTDASTVTYTDSKGQKIHSDEIDLKQGQRIQRIFEETIIDFSESQIFEPVEGVTEGYIRISHNRRRDVIALCDKFINNWTGNFVRFDISGNTAYFTIEGELTRDEWIARMTEIAPTIVYALETPIITDLTQEELDQYNALLMNYPNTTVVNDAGAYMEVEYVADTKEHIKQNYVAKSEHEALKERVSDIEQVIANL